MTIRPHSPALLAAAILGATGLISAQPQSSQLSAGELSKQVIYNEMHPAAGSSVNWRYRLDKQVNSREETRAVIET